MADLENVRRRADALIVEHLGPGIWTFDFDNAKARAGLCNYDRRRISVSRYLASRYTDEEIHQVLLHEVAHALAGSRAGHGPRWRRIATDLGYRGSRLHSGEIAADLAPWFGTCPKGHTHYRYRTPSRPLACGRCSTRFAAANLITWKRRLVPADDHRRAAAVAREGKAQAL